MNTERMENGIDKYIRQQFGVEDVDVHSFSPLTLAYIGDDVYDLIIRTLVVGKGNTQADRLHKKTSSIVKAGTQARMAEALLAEENFLTAEETSVYHRGRNAKSQTTAKNATVADYRKATGFEALIGFLYLTDRFERAVEITHKGMELLELTI